MGKGLRRVARTLGVRDQFSNTGARCAADHGELDRHGFEVGWSVIDVVFLGVAEGRPHVSRGIFDRDLVEWREPRQLGEQSKGGAHHHVLQRRWALLGATTCEWLIGFDHELPHSAFEVDVFEDPRDRPGGRPPLISGLGAHFVAQARNLVHLLAQVDAARPRMCVAHDKAVKTIAAR